jgi:large subunit ribosomal protein L25
MRYQLKAKPIETLTKGELKQLRKDGFVPISIQHRGQETLHLQEEAKPLDDFIRQHGESALIDMVIDPGNHHHTVMVHDIQRDPISQHLLQVTFQSIQRGDGIKVNVPILFHGEPAGVRRGEATLQHLTETVEIKCKPNHLPEHITVDISDMQIGDLIRVSSIKPDKGIEILTPQDTLLASLKQNTVYIEPETVTVTEGVTTSTAPTKEDASA